MNNTVDYRFYKTHASQVKACVGCMKRVVWLKDENGKYVLCDVPESEWGKTWLSLDIELRHNCERKDYIDAMKRKDPKFRLTR
jgi:hypothetical protein